MGGSANVSGRLESGDADLVDALVETAQCLVCILDPQGRIVRFNELCERATGYTEAEVLGRDIRELFIPPEHTETFSELLELVWTTHTPSPRAGEWVTRDGGRFPVVWSNRPLTDAEGRPRLFVAAGVDLSGRDVLHTQLQEQLELTSRLMEEQAALRRVATLVAGGPDPSEVFRAVSAEAARLMAADAAGVLRFDRDEVASVVGRHELADLVAFPVGGTIALGEDSAVARVFRTGSTAKIDAYEGIDETGFDRVILDLPEPWQLVKHAERALRTGGIFVAYTPSITQVSQLRETLAHSSFALAETLEVLHRTWHVEGQAVRPDHRMVAHTGFLTHARLLSG